MHIVAASRSMEGVGLSKRCGFAVPGQEADWVFAKAHIAGAYMYVYLYVYIYIYIYIDIDTCFYSFWLVL